MRRPAALFLAALFTVHAASAASIRGEEVSYQADGIRLQGYLAFDEDRQGTRPGVLVVHEWWGHNDYTRERARMLAEMGYTALAVDMYGDGKEALHPGDAQKFMQEVFATADAGRSRFVAAKSLLAAHPTVEPDNISAIGYCFGGAVVLNMARQGLDLDGVASFHGSLATQSPATPDAIKARLLVLHGADDPFIPPEHVAGFKEEMKAANADLRFIAYPGAVHAFTNPDATATGEKFELPLRYDAEADRRSWEELSRFLTALYGEN
jgi:dienelactone hydrolase